MKRWLLLALWPLAAHAGDTPDLPPAEAVMRALEAHPAVRAAEAGIAVGEARRDAIAAGPHEFSLKLEGQHRRDLPGETRYRETAVGIERPFRLPGKAARDEALGAATAEEARHAHGEALHETSRRLLKAWFDWRREAAAVAEWRAQTDTLRAQHQAVEKRVALGDAARIEAQLAEAQLVQAEAQFAQARLREAQAADALRREFPGLPLPAQPPAAAAPPRLMPPLDAWRTKMLEHNHELAVARAASRRQQIAAGRADDERIPDPALGLRLGRERDGQERLVGMQLSVPLPGAARGASARAAHGEAAIAAAQEAQTRIKVETEIGRTLSQAEAAFEHWQRLDAVAGRMEENARLLERAYRLGEGQFAELQIARRQAIEARLAATQARLDAGEAYYRVLLDAHELWPFHAGHRD